MRYAELHAKTNFTFLQGASHPDELVRRAAELEYAALAVTDLNSLAGVVRAHAAAKDAGLKLIIGAEITPADAPPVVLWATDRAAYGRLARLITQGRRRAEKGQCRLTFEDVAQHAEGLLGGVRGDIANCKLQIEGASSSLNPEPRTPNPPPDPRTLNPLHDLFGDRCYLLAELHRGPDDQRELARLVELSRQSGVPLAAAGDVHYHAPERQALCDVLTAIRHGCTVFDAGERLFPNAQRHLKPVEEIAAQFAAVPEALRRTLEIAERCTFSLDELRYEYPEELAPPGETPSQYLARLTWAGARHRYPQGVPEKVRRLLEHELQLITELHYEAYFLTVWDLVRFARQRKILCQGRGSAANSAVCFCLGVTSVDPERMDVLFERFVSRERNEAPDIDVDFEHERREEVLQYLYNKYGRDRAGMTAEVITYRPRSAIRDVGKALGMPLEQVDRIAKQVEHERVQGSGFRVQEGPGVGERGPGAGVQGEDCKLTIANCKLQMEDASSSLNPEPRTLNPLREPRTLNPLPEPSTLSTLSALTNQLIGFPRHLSQHTGGMVMTRGPLCELVPIENAAMPDRTVIQWNKDDLDELGILKVDCLALGMLTAIRKSFSCLRRYYKRNLSLAEIPEGDEDVYAMIRQADTMGVFQIESRAQMSMLPRLLPRSFYDLVIEVAIVRPGPIQGNMVHPYLRRRNGEEPVTYPSDAIRQVLEKTLGVPLFQEQAMRLAVEAAGFTPGEADQLRRAMGAWRRPGLIDQFRRKLIEGMLVKGFSQEYAEAVFNQIRGFGDYGFPESHAASFALLVYVSAWLKCHYPAAFTCALLNSQPLGFYAPAQLVRNAREHGVEVLPVDVNFSRWDCTLERGQGEESGQWSVVSGQYEESGQGEESGQWSVGSGQYEESGQCAETANHFPTAHWPLTTDHFSLRLGFRMLHGLARAHGRRIVAARGDQAYRSLEDFARRTGLSRSVLVRLTKAGTFGSLGLDRRSALWDALEQDQKELPLFGIQGSGVRVQGSELSPRMTPFQFAIGHLASDLNSAIQNPKSETKNLPPLPPMSLAEEVLADYRTLGLSLKAHPMQFLRNDLKEMGVATAAELKTWPNGEPIRVAGIVLVRQRPGTAKGITFVTLEDETGTANLIIRPAVWQRYRPAALGATLLLAQGSLQREGLVIHVLTTRLEDLSERFKEMGPQSRDFC